MSKKYKIKDGSTLIHDGQTLQGGDKVELDDKQALANASCLENAPHDEDEGKSEGREKETRNKK